MENSSEVLSAGNWTASDIVEEEDKEVREKESWKNKDYKNSCAAW